MSDATPLENPIWYALASHQNALGQTYGRAAVFNATISRFAGLESSDATAFSDLSSIVSSSERVALFTATPLEVPAEWEVLRSRALEQMECHRLRGEASELELQLSSADVREMLALAEATEPGPFFAGTINMGRYYGIRSGNQLAAMAGERLRLKGFTEISAVCTDPAFRGKGLARKLVAGLTAKVLGEGTVPFLHVKNENGAKVLYEALGYEVARAIHLTVMQKR